MRVSAVRVLAAAVAAVAVALLICGAARTPTRTALGAVLTGGRPVPRGAVAVAAGLALLVLARGLAGGRRLALYGLAVSVAAAGALPAAAALAGGAGGLPGGAGALPGAAALAGGADGLVGGAYRPARLAVGVAVAGLLLALYRLFPVR